MNPAINKTTKGLGGSFKGVTLYLVTPKEAEPGAPMPERTGFIFTQNLPTDDAGQAWRIMARTAQDREALKAAAGVSAAGRKVKADQVKAVFHYALSWHPDQRPTPEQMQQAARSSLSALKLDAHQALIVQHVDEDRAHLHVVVNRVHPETGKLDPLSNNIRRLDRWANEYEKASGEIVSRDRAAKYEALDKGDPPPPPRKATPRKEWEAQRPPKAERTADHAASVDRYKQAAADVRERFRPEWANHYREQRRQEQVLAKAQRATLANLKRAAQMQRTPTPQPFGKVGKALGLDRKNQLVAFYNQNRELIWQGIPVDQRPKDSRAIVNAPAMRRAIENAHAAQRAELDAAQAAAKKDLQARHEQARQEAQRAAWKAPAPAKPAAEPAQPEKAPRRDWGSVAIGAAVIATAAIAARQKRPADPALEKPGRDPQRNLDEAAARSAKPTIGSPANESRETPKPPQDDLAQHRARADAAAERIRQARERNARARNRGRERDWLD